MTFENSEKSDFTIYPFLWLSICFAVGIVIANFSNLSWQILLSVCLIFAVLSAIFFKKNTAIILLLLAFTSLGGFYFSLQNQAISPNRLKILLDSKQINSGDPIEIEGVLKKEPEMSVGGFFILFEAENAFYKNKNLQVSGKIRLFAPLENEQTLDEYKALDLHYNSKIRIATQLNREDEFQNPGLRSRREILDQQEIDATGMVKSLLLIEKISDSESFSPLAQIYKYRQKIIEDFRTNFSSSTSGILIASLLGNRYFLNKQTAEIFRDGGTFHVLVISGLHITFIGGLILLFVRFFTKQRFWQFVIASAFLWAYALAVGAEVPVIRAALMFTVLLFSQVIYRSGTLLNALGASVMVLLIWRPDDVFNQSFQLTIASVTAMIAMAFPLIEKLREIGNWTPTAEKPFPPNVSKSLKRFCETIYWRENVWEIEIARQIWTANLFKSPHLKRLLEKDLQFIFRFVFEGILVSFVVQIWLLPFLIVYFHRLSFISVILNLWVGFVIALESFAAIFALFVAQISKNLALPFIKTTELLNWFLISIPQFFIENFPSATRIPVYSGNLKAIYFLYFLPVLGLTILLNLWKPFLLKLKSGEFTRKIRNFLSFSFITLFALIIFHPFSAPFADGRLTVKFLDVGQGDSIFVRFPDGETMLIDGGGKMNFSNIYISGDDGEEPEKFEPDSPSIGESVVSEFLWEEGYSKIDYILATHADADHIQGLSDVAKNFGVKKAFFGRTPFEDEEFQQLFSIMKQKNIEYSVISRGENLNFGNVKIEVLFPKSDDSPKPISNNNNSVVLRLIYKNRKFLLTGDIEKETEKFLTENSTVQADVVKVAHHGSRTSSIAEFVTASKAVYAVIPVGKKSRFGHPHREVVERWQNSGAKILTTGESGTISISTDGTDLNVETYLK